LPAISKCQAPEEFVNACFEISSFLQKQTLCILSSQTAGPLDGPQEAGNAKYISDMSNAM